MNQSSEAPAVRNVTMSGSKSAGWTAAIWYHAGGHKQVSAKSFDQLLVAVRNVLKGEAL